MSNKEHNRQELLDKVKEIFPNINEDFVNITLDELELHEKKNWDYARTGDSIGNFKRVAKILENYPNLKGHDPRVVALLYMLKQLDATFWMISQGYDGNVESIDDRLRDVHVYAKIVRIINMKMKREE